MSVCLCVLTLSDGMRSCGQEGMTVGRQTLSDLLDVADVFHCVIMFASVLLALPVLALFLSSSEF